MTPYPHLPRIKIVVENSSDDKDGLQSTSEKSISVLLADSSPMQLQLLTASLRRRPEFKVVSCPLDADILHQAIKTSSPEILVFARNTNNKAPERYGASTALASYLSNRCPDSFGRICGARPRRECISLWSSRAIL